MYGTILGDMIGAPYEFDRGKKIKDFPLFVNESQFTDDMVMTIMLALLERFTEKIGRKFQSGKSNDGECLSESEYFWQA